MASAADVARHLSRLSGEGKPIYLLLALSAEAGRDATKAGGVKYDAKAPHRPLMPVELICQMDGLPMPEPEFHFDVGRRWRFDYAWPAHKIAVEIEGGVWIRGRHNRAKGYILDMEKYSTAAIMGWCVIRILPQQIPQLGELVGRALIMRGCHVANVAVHEMPTSRDAEYVSQRPNVRGGTRTRNATARRTRRGVRVTGIS